MGDKKSISTASSSMDLKEFVERSLIEISEGVFAAKEKSKIAIAPGRYDNVAQTQSSEVNFELAVTVAKKGAGGIKVLSAINLEGGIDTQLVSKMNFSVPVFFQGLKGVDDQKRKAEPMKIKSLGVV